MSDKNKLKRSRKSSEESDSSSDSSSTSSSDEETDAKDFKPVKEYISNRKELASQLFKSVKTEKIRMMLPQILKKVEFNDLEELCANELIGMSKARIMCIINGQEMLQSSNTDDSDDLDSALEIISDTEWLSNEEASAKEGTSLKNKYVKKSKNKPLEQKRQNSQTQLKSKGKGKVNVKVKTETKEKEKVKEGESLLDLLELEMRARAIRALIRKEEDPSNSKNLPKNDAAKTGSTVSGAGTSSSNKNLEARQENLKEQLEKIDVLMNHGEDEDVFVVIQPAPTIELISSESETDDHSRRVNQKLVNERSSENKKAQENEKNKNKDVNKENSKSNENKTNTASEKINRQKDKSENIKEKDNLNDSANLLVNKAGNVNGIKDDSNKLLKTIDLEDGEIIDDNDNEKAASEGGKVLDESLLKRRIKKVKKNPNIRSKKKSRENNEGIACDKTVISANELSRIPDTDNNSSKRMKTSSAETRKRESVEKISEKAVGGSAIIKSADNSKYDLYDDKSFDIDEVINLDDYPDDMDDLEKNDEQVSKKVTGTGTSRNPDKEANSNEAFRPETWATRYYKQDDVQSVIKESKIQSEIRKRLRERQRLSKLNNLPKSKSQEVGNEKAESVLSKPTGSVKEYLALKEISSETSSNSTSSELLKQSDRLVMPGSALLIGDGGENKSLPPYDNKTVEQSAAIVKKAMLIADKFIPKTVKLTLNDNAAVEQSSGRLNDDPFVNDGESCAQKKLKESRESLGQSESNPLRSSNETSRDNDLVVSDEKFVEESNERVGAEQIILSRSKISELRPD